LDVILAVALPQYVDVCNANVNDMDKARPESTSAVIVEFGGKMPPLQKLTASPRKCYPGGQREIHSSGLYSREFQQQYLWRASRAFHIRVHSCSFVVNSFLIAEPVRD
jgi:hypothetical protein